MPSALALVTTGPSVTMFFGIPAPALAAVEDGQLWTTASATVKLSDRWRISQEFVGRFSDNRNGLYEIESEAELQQLIEVEELERAEATRRRQRRAR